MNETDFVNDPQTDPEPISFPWPPREGDSVLEAFASTWKESVFRPVSFFRSMPHDGSFGSVLLYYIIISVIAAGLQLFWRSVLPPLPLHHLIPGFPMDAVDRGGDVTSFLLTPIVVLIALYIVAGILHVMLKMIGGAHHEFDVTTRTVAYTHGPAVFALIPYAGNLIAGIWTLVLTVIGLRETQETTTGKAIVAVILPACVIAILGVLAALAIVATGLLKVPV